MCVARTFFLVIELEQQGQASSLYFVIVKIISWHMIVAFLHLTLPEECQDKTLDFDSQLIIFTLPAGGRLFMMTVEFCSCWANIAILAVAFCSPSNRLTYIWCSFILTPPYVVSSVHGIGLSLVVAALWKSVLVECSHMQGSHIPRPARGWVEISQGRSVSKTDIALVDSERKNSYDSSPRKH